MNILSTAARRAILATQTSEAFLLLLEITHPDRPTPLRYVNPELDITSGGDVYSARGFEVPLASESRSTTPSLNLLIDNADREVWLAVLQMKSTKKPQATLKLILASQPDIVERNIFDLIVADAVEKSPVVSMTLSNDEVLGGPFPCDTVTPATHPGCFGANGE